MWLKSRRPLAFLVAAGISQGCVSVHAPLKADENFPPVWGELTSLGPECKALNGAYLNQGATAAADGRHEPVSLTSVLNIRSDARIVSLGVRTRRVDENGDAFVTLRITPDGDNAAPKEREGCFCIKGTLACTQVSEASWGMPYVYFGGSQSNVYFSMTSQRALVAKLQNYRADVIIVMPIFGMQEPWVRFERASQ